MVGAGRPLKYKSKKALQEAIDGYFASCKGRVLTDATGQPIRDKYGLPIIVDVFSPTVTGLARYLGFKSRQALINYQEKEAYYEIVLDAKMRIEEYAERRLFDRDGVRGAMFTLCNNFGWGEEKDSKSTDNINKDICALAELINNPQPNRYITDFEGDTDE